jgi:hypothetical protein
MFLAFGVPTIVNVVANALMFAAFNARLRRRIAEIEASTKKAGKL